MDDPNITMEEYIRLEEEKARKRGKVFNWETAKYGKIWYDEDIHDLRSVETEFPAIAFNDEVSSDKTLSCEPMVSSLNDEIDFRVLFNNFDDEDYTVVFDKNSFSYKKNSANDLKTDSENDNEKFMPSLLSPEPTVSCFDDLDFFKDFENEFPTIVYNNAQTSKSDLLTEPILNPQHTDEFNLKDETSLSECDEEEQNILNFNDLFPFNVVAPGQKRQPDAAAGAPRAAKGAPAVDEAKTMPQRLGRLEEEIQGLRQDVRSLCGLVERSMTDQGRFSTWMIGCMTKLIDASGQTYQAFDGTFQGSSPLVFERRTR
ncbi:hypothetical protein Tco_1410340 [Tanacetum coccineum]